MMRACLWQLRVLTVIGVLVWAGLPSWGQPATTGPVQRTTEEVQKLIDEAGKKPPEWWDSVNPTWPKTLDMTWSEKDKSWNNQKNVGQYMWDIVNPNPNKWREGAKLMHQVLIVNQKDKAVVTRAMDALVHVYFDLLQDYPRAAFWAQKSGRHAVTLAYCYYRLGSKPMAVKLLEQMGDDETRNGTVIKAWADFGELETALELARVKAEFDWEDAAELAAGDACRLAGRTKEALAHYEKVLTVDKGGIDLKRNKERAQASIDAIKLFDTLDLTKVPDGTYASSSLGYTGPIEVDVTVKGGRIEQVKVTKHTEKQFYAAISETTAAIVQKQSVKGIDATSGATITSEAIINASAKALSGAMK